jgi:hypothetical protein
MASRLGVVVLALVSSVVTTRVLTIGPARSPASAHAAEKQATALSGAGLTHWVADLWAVDFTLHDIVDLRLPNGAARRETRFDGIRYSVGPFPDMVVSANNLRGTYFQKLDVPDQKVEQVWKSSGVPVLPLNFDETRRELTVGRFADFRCNDSIRVQTEASRNTTGTPNTFVLSSRLHWPANWTTTVRTSPPATVTMDMQDVEATMTLLDAEVRYKYDSLVNRGTVNLPAYVSMKTVKRTITYEVRRKKMEMELLPQCRAGMRGPDCVKDLTNTLTFCTGCRPVTNNHAVDPASGLHHLHPNIEIRLRIDGEDATHYMTTTPSGDAQYFDVARRRRTWLGPPGAVKPVIETEPGRMGNLRNGWYDDYTGLVNGRPNWADMPSSKLLAPAGWPTETMIEEFLVGVKRFPEFGFLYFATILDTRPNGYRVRQTEPRRIAENDWCRIEQTSTGPEVDYTKIRDDSGWCNASGRCAP